jgi:Bacterial pre-peptidase C-terminal domain
VRSWGALRRGVVGGAAGLVVLLGTWAGATPVGLAAPVAGPPAQPTKAQRAALRAGLQVAPKTRVGTPGADGLVEPDPALATLPSLLRADYSGWRTRDAVRARERMASSARAAARVGRTGRASAAPVGYTEAEPVSAAGANDTQAAAERLKAFGTGRGDHAAVDVAGTIAGRSVSTVQLGHVAEDNGQLSLATPTPIHGVGRVLVSSVLGDGPHGTQPGADGNNDYDFYALSAGAGERITVSTSGSQVDTVVALYGAAGQLLGQNDDAAPTTTSSLLTYATTRAGTYYALVAGKASSGGLPPDPRDSGSGSGDADYGAYRLDLSAVAFDTDFYRLDLAAGDVLGATVHGATSLRIFLPSGTAAVAASGSDVSGVYPAGSPLPGGGLATLAYVAERAGAYALQVDGPPGAYTARVEAYRPGTEGKGATRKQTILLDFDGETVDTSVFGGPGERTLSPMRDFLVRWGLPPSKEKELVKRITAGVEENLRRDLARRGLNHRLSVTVTSRSTGVNRWGRTEVSRVVIGGTSAQAGIDTIGVASAIDPGNYSHRDSALVLLDTLSSPNTANEGSLNHYLTAKSDRLDFMAQAVANVASHEVGHFVGSFHTDGQDSTHNLMDEGGTNFGANLYGVGPDGVGGTSDDEDVDFRSDAYSRLESLTGRENTLNVSAWAFVRPGG